MSTESTPGVLGALWDPAATSQGFAALPSPARPHVLVPLDGRRTAARSVTDYARHAGRGGRLRAGGLAGLVTVLGPGALRWSRVRDPGGIAPELLAGLRATVAQESTVVAVHLGPPRRNRKPVLQVLGPHGDLLAVVKIGVDDLTDTLVRTEHAALGALARRGPLDAGVHVAVPAAGALWEWGGHPVAVQSPLSLRGRRRSVSRADLQGVVRWIAGPPATAVPVLDSTWWQQISGQIALLGTDVVGADRLREARDALAEALSGAVLPMASWHGDLTPWNMSRQPSGIAVWDWERYAAAVPWGFDLAHHRLQAVDYRHATASAIPDVVADLRQQLGDDLGAGQPEQVVRCYALELATRYIREGQVSLLRGGMVTDIMLDLVNPGHGAIGAPSAAR